MTRLFLNPEKISGDKAIIEGINVRYLTHVLRYTEGDELILLDGRGKGYKGKISLINRNKIDVRILEEIAIVTESPIEITLAQGIPKAEKMELIIQKATELGINRIIPLVTGRSIMKPKGAIRLQRWLRIATSSAQQSGRSIVPVIGSITGFKEYMTQKHSGAGLIFYEGEEKMGLKEFLKGLKGIKEIIFLIGPEGGFTDEEYRMALEKGFTSVGLGPRILRTETAAITALSILQYELGDLG